MAFARILGTYPKLADETLRLAFVGAMVPIIAAGAVALLFRWMLVSSVVLSSGDVVGIAPLGFGFLSVMLSITTGFVLFGVASLRSVSLSRSTGYLLLNFAVQCFVILAVTTVYGAGLPG